MNTQNAEGEVPDSQPALEKLARLLAANYVDTSISTDALKYNRGATFKRVFKPASHELMSDPPTRNILVVGAGTSTAAFGPEAFPPAKAATCELNRRLETDETLGLRPNWINARIDEEKDRLRVAYGYTDANDDFETNLAILSNVYSPTIIARKLAEMYRERYWPHLTFELIGHMLKHRFIDVVINFNFDELLNQAIDEELGQSDKHYVVSDGDCLDLGSVMVGNRLKVPIHIKPHGTAGHQSTLRFTKEHYFTLPEPMRLFLQKIIDGYVSDDSTAKPYATNIISVGFGMRSLDLNQILRLAVKPEHSISMFHVNTGGWFADNVADLPHRTGISNHELIDVDHFGTLHNTLRSLVTAVGTQFQAPYTPRGIARHEIVHKLFFNEDTRRRIPEGGAGTEPTADTLLPPHERHQAAAMRRLKSDALYFRARLCTELIISLAKNHRRIDLTSLVDDRVGTYFDQLRDVSKKVDGDNPEAASLNQVLELFTQAGRPLPLVGIERNILTAACERSSSDDYGEWLWKALSTVLAKIGSPELSEHVGRLSSSPEVRALFQALTKSDSRDINPRFQHRQLLLARAPDADDVLHTNLSLTLKLAEIVNGKRDWDVLLAVSEYGSVLAKCMEHIPETVRRNKSFFMVVAQSTDLSSEPEDISSLLPAGVAEHQVEIRWLPYWLHNRHMVLGLKLVGSRPADFEFTNAIRYDRRGASNRINPVNIDYHNRLDLERLMDTFFGYVWLAENPGWISQKLTDEQLRENARNKRSKMLSEWRSKHQPL
jgi:hypothetical protein